MGGLMYKISGGRWGEMNIKHVQLPNPDKDVRKKNYLILYCNSFI